MPFFCDLNTIGTHLRFVQDSIMYKKKILGMSEVTEYG